MSPKMLGTTVANICAPRHLTNKTTTTNTTKCVDRVLGIVLSVTLHFLLYFNEHDKRCNNNNNNDFMHFSTLLLIKMKLYA